MLTLNRQFTAAAYASAHLNAGLAEGTQIWEGQPFRPRLGWLFVQSPTLLNLGIHGASAPQFRRPCNAQKLNRSSSSKNLRILRQTKKVPLRASNVCNKYLTNESLEAVFSFFFLLPPRHTAAAQSSRNKAVLDYELGKMAPPRQAGFHGPFLTPFLNTKETKLLM